VIPRIWRVPSPANVRRPLGKGDGISSFFGGYIPVPEFMADGGVRSEPWRQGMGTAFHGKNPGGGWRSILNSRRRDEYATLTVAVRPSSSVYPKFEPTLPLQQRTSRYDDAVWK
jgi:hypothetical protein